MLLALGAASSAMDAIQALASSASSSTQSTGFAQPFAISSPASTAGNGGSVTTGFGAPSQISPATMQALLAAQSQSSTTSTSTPTSRSAALQNLFSQIDANGDGQITKSEFENALGAGGTNTAQADSVFNQLDTNSDGSVSLSELSAALKGKGGGHHAAWSYNSLDQMMQRQTQAISFNA
jgi:Ca2+-binding EF-hand superfamily protein